MNFDLIINPLKKINPQKIILFGSYAYGKPNKDSDLDILVIVNTDKGFNERIQQIRPLLPKDKAIDLIVLTPEEIKRSQTTNLLVQEIVSKGKVIYG